MGCGFERLSLVFFSCLAGSPEKSSMGILPMHLGWRPNRPQSWNRRFDLTTFWRRRLRIALFCPVASSYRNRWPTPRTVSMGREFLGSGFSIFHNSRTFRPISV